MKSLKTYLLVSVLLSGSGHLFQCTLQLKYTKVLIEPHFDYCSAVWDGLTQQLSEKLQNFKIVLSELSPDLAMMLVPDFFLTRLVGTTYRLEEINKRLI